MRGLRKPIKTWTYSLVAGCAAVALLLSCSVETLRADGPNLAGTWKLNEKKSDDVRAKMQAARNQNQDQPQGPDAGGPGGNQGNGPEANGGPDSGGPRGMRGGPGGRGGMMADFSQLTIEQTATTAKVTGASGRVLAVLGPGADSSAAPAHAASADDMPDNSDAGPRPRRGPPPPAVAHWTGSQLVSETQNPRGGKMTRTYELSPDGSELFVSTKMENPNLSEPVTFRQVYDRTKAN